MTQPGRSGFDAHVALATASARAPVPPPPVTPLVPRWRRPLSRAKQLARRVLRPVLARLRGDAAAQAHRDILALLDSTRRESRQAFDSLQREVDAARTELRLVYTGLVDDIHAARQATGQELAVLHARSDAMLAAIEALQRGQADAAPQAPALARQHGELQQSLQLAIDQLGRVETYALTSARRVALPCAGGEMLVRTEAGYILCADSDIALLSALVDTGEIERGTRLLIESLLRPGDCFVDVGANIGMHTLAAGRAMGAQGTIIAFEPYEPTRRLLLKSLWINGLEPITRVHGCALSDRAGSQPLFLGASSGHHSLFAAAGEEARLDQVQVPTMRLDDVLEPGRRVTLIKIDAEGAELAVLAGAAATLRGNPDIALIVEFGPAHLRRVGHDTAHWLAAFKAFGFVYRAIDPVTGVLAQQTVAELETNESVNLFFARPGTAAWAHVTGP